MLLLLRVKEQFSFGVLFVCHNGLFLCLGQSESPHTSLLMITDFLFLFLKMEGGGGYHFAVVLLVILITLSLPAGLGVSTVFISVWIATALSN